jgi:hypothetical protein
MGGRGRNVEDGVPRYGCGNKVGADNAITAGKKMAAVTRRKLDWGCLKQAFTSWLY